MSKKSYSIKQELVARFANALANPARVAICELLSERQYCFFGEIEEALPLSKATVSQHLCVLKEAGFVDSENVPPRVKYSINQANWKLAEELFVTYMSATIFGDYSSPEDEETESESNE